MKENNNDDNNDDNSYNQMIIYNMRIINKIYTWFQDLTWIFSFELINIFHDIFDHW